MDPRDSRELPAEESADLCAGCVKCCTYITVEIDSPRAAWEYDQWIWALHHRHISLNLERPERWFLQVETVCEKLNEQGRCSIHGRHPVLCREYDPRSCERRLPLADTVATFKDGAEFERWLEANRPVHWKRLMAFRRDQPAGPPVADAHADRRNGSGLIPVSALARSAAPASNGRPARPSRGRR